MALTRYVATRDAIETMLREVRELVQNLCVMSSTLKDGRTMVAEEWRHEVAYRTLLLLRTTMVALEYPIHQTLPWTIPELNGMEANDIKNNLLSMTNTPSVVNDTNSRNYNAIWEDVLRVPIRIEYILRKSVHSNMIRLTEPIPIQLELKIFTSIDNFMNGYYSMRKFLTTVRIPTCRSALLGGVRIRFFSRTLIHCFTAGTIPIDSNVAYTYVHICFYRPFCDAI